MQQHQPQQQLEPSRRQHLQHARQPCQESADVHGGQQQLAQSKKRRARKATFYVRREEKTALQAELALLQTQLAFASRQQRDRSPSSAPPSVLLAQLQQALWRRQVENEVLRDALRGEAFAPRLPFESDIRLGADWSERHATLRALRDAKIRDAQCYVSERTAFIDARAPFSETSHFVSAAGDMSHNSVDTRTSKPSPTLSQLPCIIKMAGSAAGGDGTVDEVPHPSALAMLSPPPSPAAPADDKKRSPLSPPRASKSPSADRPSTSAASEELSSSAKEPPANTTAGADKPKKVRRRTYYVRKEETEELQDELRGLEARMAYYHAREGLADQLKHIRRQQQDNRLLRGAIRSQWLQLASAHGMTGRFLQEHSRASSLTSTIRLGRDPAQRHATLLGLKAEKLTDAVSFLHERGAGVSRARASVDSQRFESEQGDYCAVRFDVTPFEGLRSARRVFDAYLNFAFNMEINVSETLGDVTIREDDEVIGRQSDGVSHHRMVSTIAHSVQLDLNSVVFSEFFESADAKQQSVLESTGADELGVVVFDVVDDDALYPYRPSERVRQDITCLAMVTSLRRPKPSKDARSSAARKVSPGGRRVGHRAPAEEEDELVVVLHRWSLLKVHRSELRVPEEIQARIRSGIEHVGDAILANVRQAVYAPSSAPSPQSGYLPER